MNYKTYLNIILIALFLIISNSMYVIDERQQAVVTHLENLLGKRKQIPGYILKFLLYKLL